MADGPPESKRSRSSSNQNRFEQSPDWTRVFNLTSVKERLYPAFAILQLGPDCNAYTSVSFTEAKCNFKKVGEGGTPYLIDFDDIFSKGIDFLFDLKNDTRVLNEDEQRAVDILCDFLEGKDKHEQSLLKVLEKCNSEEGSDRKTNSFETDITVALAEHLLGKLAPGKNCVIDNRAREKKEGKCKCGLEHCIREPVFESTGIGDERAWHGFIDILFTSHPVATVTSSEFSGKTSRSNQNLYNQALGNCITMHKKDDEEDSPGEKTICEMKLSSKDHGIENHAIAQTIVFSYIQRKRHPSFNHFLIPNILISPYHFRILMYDSQNDILICSVKLPIFQDEISDKLSIESVVFLWMVLHYKMFCVGINVQELLNIGAIRDLKEIQSNFPERAGDKLDLYLESFSKIGISRFKPVFEEALPSYDSLVYGKRLFKLN